MKINGVLITFCKSPINRKFVAVRRAYFVMNNATKIEISVREYLDLRGSK